MWLWHLGKERSALVFVMAIQRCQAWEHSVRVRFFWAGGAKDIFGSGRSVEEFSTKGECEEAWTDVCCATTAVAAAAAAAGERITRASLHCCFPEARP